jgi:ATP-dependent helicase/nuclease subunit A
MTPEPLTDDRARRAIRSDLHDTLFVEAGAGTGKTRELVARIVALVAEGVALPRIAAITFTNAAAAELRERVRLELERTAREDVAREPPFSAEQRENCRLALGTIDAASIQTLHSFAQRILSLYPIEAGLPPQLDLRDDIAASIAFEDRWQPFLDELLKDGYGDPGVAAALVRAMTLGLTIEHLHRLAKRFHEEWDRVLPAQFAQPPMPAVTAEQVVAGLQDACDRQRDLKPGKQDDKAYLALLRLGPLLEELRDAQEALTSAQTADDRLVAEEQIIRLLAFNGKLAVGRIGQQGNWEGGALAVIRDASLAASDARSELLSELRAACLGPLLGVLQAFVRDYRDERIAQGTLEFHDLLVLTRDLLAGRLDVRRALASRYQALLIDEFQDTDPIQVEIAVLIASTDPKAGQKPWDTAPVPPGRLFFVGDPKQSIYRFRRADIEVYTAAAARFGDGGCGRTAPLVTNFRSVPSVITWVNHVFAELFRLERTLSGAGSAGQVVFQPLDPSRESDPASPVSVHLLGEPLASGVSAARAQWTPAGRTLTRTLARDLRETEAAGIAAMVARIKDEGARAGLWRVWLDDAKEWNAPRLADVAILLPTRTALPALEEALSTAGIPCRVESRSLLFDTPEVRDLLTILAAIDDPTDQVAVVAALRAPGFGCSDRDLFRFRSAGHSWDYSRAAPEGLPAEDLVMQSMAALKALHACRWWLDPAEMVDSVIRERRLFQVAFAARRPRDSWQRLRFLHEQARAFTGAGGRGLRQFIRFMDLQAKEDALLTDTVVAERDDDAVRIMTVHASKGLEFPIVILAGLNVGPNREGPALLWGTAGEPQVRAGNAEGPFATAGFDDARSHDQAMDRLEKDRLLYVAATRARDHLVVSVYHSVAEDAKPHAERHNESKCTAAECLYAISSGEPSLWLPAMVEGAVAPRAEATAPSPARPDSAADREAWQDARTKLIAGNARMAVVAATAIAKSAAAAAGPVEKDEPLEDEAPWKKGRAGTSVGRAVHAVLQTVDLATGDGLAAAARAQTIAESVEDRLEDVVRFARAALDSDAVREAVASGRSWREVYVSAPVDGVVVEGFVDLLYETPEGLVVVDYKTDTVGSAEAVDRAMERYRLQGAAYVLALQESLGRPVARCVFVFVQPRHERTIPDLAAALDEVRRIIPTALSAAAAR